MARTLLIRPVAPLRRPLGFTQYGFKQWTPSLVLWGVGVGATLSLLLSNTPLFQNDVLKKIPVLGDTWVDKTPAEDKPF